MTNLNHSVKFLSVTTSSLFMFAMLSELCWMGYHEKHVICWSLVHNPTHQTVRVWVPLSYYLSMHRALCVVINTSCVYGLAVLHCVLTVYVNPYKLCVQSSTLQDTLEETCAVLGRDHFEQIWGCLQHTTIAVGKSVCFSHIHLAFLLFI